MVSRSFRPLLAAIVVALAAGSAAAQATAEQVETSSDVPALSAFHEVIYPLWHQAWPNKDTAMVKELLPAVERHVADIERVALPGILRDRQARWAAGVQELHGVLEAYRDAVRRDDGTAMLEAVERLHAGYESLVRTVRPPMKELEDFHIVLYGLYHHTVPDGRLEDVPAAAAALSSRCRALAATQLPRRAAARADEIGPAIAALCEATTTFEAGAGSGDRAAVSAALEGVHARYQAVERLFE